jgi:dipeptidyl aminopeptidase/acylaminoacyl peptidase
MPSVAPYGSWKSPVTTDLIVAETISLGQIALDGDDVYWIEGRPRDGGRNVVVRNGADVTTRLHNVRTRVHEYGGGAFFVDSGTVYFSNFTDQRLHMQTVGGMPKVLTRAVNLQYADGIVDRARNRLICVREDHTVADREAVNTIVAVALDDGTEEVLVSGNDFYSSPRLSPDSARLAWLAWNHPNMPWDGTELFVDGQRIAGGPSESIIQPEWSPDGSALYFISDRTGWWNLYRWRDGQTEPVCPLDAEFALPAWVFGLSSYAFIDADRLACAYNVKGSWQLAVLDLKRGDLLPLPVPYTTISQVRANEKRIVFLGASPTEPESVVSLDLGSHAHAVLRRSATVSLDAGSVSVAEAIEFPTENGLTAHAFYYPPRNAAFAGPPGELPPLIVMIHGGPTSATSNAFSLQKQFWTSRGFAVVDVNYGGSTGYGRAYRDRLKGNWGIVDVDDCCNAARYLANASKADPQRLIIRGGSAGGYTTLCALTFREVFKAGASYYGISDLEASNETHKFESRYNHRLVAPWPEGKEVYRQRSPLFALDRLKCPIIFFQGLEDKVVLPNQSEMMVEAMKKKGVPVEYHAFEGEQHGFRKADTIKRVLEAELAFYGRVFGFSPGN